MTIKSVLILGAFSFSLSACMMTEAKKDEMAAIKAQQPVISKAASKSVAAEKCSVDGFCALPGLKKYQKNSGE